MYNGHKFTPEDIIYIFTNSVIDDARTLLAKFKISYLENQIHKFNQHVELLEMVLNSRYSQKKFTKQHQLAQIDCIDLLLNSKANVNQNETKMMNLGSCTPYLHKCDLTKDVYFSLINAKANVNILDQIGNIPLFTQIKNNSPRFGVIKLLVENKADLTHHNHQGENILSFISKLMLERQKMDKINESLIQYNSMIKTIKRTDVFIRKRLATDIAKYMELLSVSLVKDCCGIVIEYLYWGKKKQHV